MQSTSGCTIVSIVPFSIRERKPGLVPSEFHIPATPAGSVSVLHVQTASFPVYIDEARGSLRVHTPTETLARSIVDDYLRGQYGREENAQPGIFWVPGIFTVEEVKKNFPKELAEAKQKQDNWFAKLIQLADDEWVHSHQHKNINDPMRYAAKALGISDRPWLAPVPKAENQDCPACGGQIKPNIVICPHCSYIIDEGRHSKMKFAGV